MHTYARARETRVQIFTPIFFRPFGPVEKSRVWSLFRARVRVRVRVCAVRCSKGAKFNYVGRGGMKIQ
jgi:hypothetical protein